MASGFRTAIEFLSDLGVYDVVLPFLLVFTTVFAILEKSKIFGTEKLNDTEYTKKNLNSMFSFVTSFLVVASTSLVKTINEAVANVVLLMLLGVCFLLLAGTFHTGKEEFKIEGPYKTIFTIVFLIGIFLIFLNALKTKEGTSWLEYGWKFIVDNIGSGDFGALILSLFMIGMMFWITKGNSKPKEESGS